MKKLILCDFDGTISIKDMGYVLLNRFSSGDWEPIDRDYREGKIGSREAYSRIVKILTGDPENAIRFIREHSDIDPYFKSFYQYCRENDIDVKIVSDGLDFYIRTILEIHGLSDIPFYANATHPRIGGGIDISFPHVSQECGFCGTCKKQILLNHRKDYEKIFFAGNGLSDRCAAQEADLAFAKESLYPYCIDQDITCHYFRDFGDILRDIKKRIRGIIFDLDGTLIEAYGAIYLGLKEVFERSGKEIFPYEDLRHYLQADLESTLHQFYSPEETQKNIPVMRKRYEEVYLSHTHFLDGARETLDTLFHRGAILGVASNKFGRFSRLALNHLGVSSYFKTVIGAGDVPRNKPFPDMIQAALSEMGLSQEEVVFVGDTLTDIETGKEAGVDVYALPTGFHTRKELSQKKPKRILRELKELIDLLDQSL
ncbi:MAG: HAD family hydrolase [Deltaproteobacteria bacterium]|nr:HAD family hydrolase [Deltaproteobacteria bacterium]